eukprot:5937204-Alexandrium_andersonii.AAC.1
MFEKALAGLRCPLDPGNLCPLFLKCTFRRGPAVHDFLPGTLRLLLQTPCCAGNAAICCSTPALRYRAQ